LPQHGFARTAKWEYLGKSTSESSSSSVKLDFGLSSDRLSDATKALWPYKFTLLYSVILDEKSLTTTLVVANDGDESFDFQMLLHTYFNIKASGACLYSQFAPKGPKFARGSSLDINTY
jgi:glucose-6-phosphate 1-epimerase